ncbi:uncharacterized protein LOC108683338 [Hyalella azteca]|uniref:Uncharacterized protein LOC108683338 n=1 Tax=Hyalella azteca TaxID=294128 RepID=A0A8B7PPJ7_HYAAZ|nr:uncharacterized protein LOC108683338 [Hyalella azteca]
MSSNSICSAPFSPWINANEWLMVYDQLMDSNVASWTSAHQTLSSWVSCTDRTPEHVYATLPVLAARCTLQSTELCSAPGASTHLNLPGPITSGSLICLVVNNAVIEFINIFVKGVESISLSNGRLDSLQQMASEAGLPPDLIPLRNSLVHSTDHFDTSTYLLHSQVVDIMWNYLKEKYWDVEYLVLQRRCELLASVENDGSVIEGTSSQLTSIVQTILATVQSQNSNKKVLSNAPVLFRSLKEALLESLNNIEVFIMEGQVLDYDGRVQNVLKILVEDFLLAPSFGQFILKEQASCSCGSRIDLSRVLLKKLLVGILTKAPERRVPKLVGLRTNIKPSKAEHYRQNVGCANHVFAILLEHINSGSDCSSLALEWFKLLLSNCAPYEFPDSSSCLKCGEHNLFLSDVKVASVKEPQTGCSLRGKAVPNVLWSSLISVMLTGSNEQLVQEAARLVEACISAMQDSEVRCLGRAVREEQDQLRILEQQINSGLTQGEAEYRLWSASHPPTHPQAKKAGFLRLIDRTRQQLHYKDEALHVIGSRFACVPLGDLIIKPENDRPLSCKTASLMDVVTSSDGLKTLAAADGNPDEDIVPLNQAANERKRKFNRDESPSAGNTSSCITKNKKTVLNSSLFNTQTKVVNQRNKRKRERKKEINERRNGNKK